MPQITHRDLVAFADEKVNLKKSEVDDQRAQVNRLRERIEAKIAATPGYGLVKSLHAGSVAKGTALRNVNDRDLAVYVRAEQTPEETRSLVLWLRDHLRHMLVHTGVLPERTEYLERIGPWLDNLLADQTADDSSLIRAYAQWDVLRRARQRASQRSFSYDVGRRARTMIRVALELLIWLRNRGQSLSHLRQEDIESWLSAHPGRRSYLINGFLKWANNRGLARKITVAMPPRDNPANFLDDDQRWYELHRCLTDDGISLPARVAGALLFLYGSSQAG